MEQFEGCWTLDAMYDSVNDKKEEKQREGAPQMNTDGDTKRFLYMYLPHFELCSSDRS